jgi:hypothetical protein
LFLEKEQALGLTGALLKTSSDIVKNSIYNFLVDSRNIEQSNQKTMEFAKFISRKVKNFNVMTNLAADQGKH